jgi:3-oxoacyl-[acyl-carrier protein] reductase
VGTATAEAGVAAIAATFAENSVKGQGMVLDVAAPASIDAFVKALDGAALVPSVLVNNAGITRDMLLMRMTDDDWNASIETNLNSIYRLSKAVLRNMMRLRFGRIISITSVVAQVGNVGQCNYAAAKAGVVGFTRALAREVGSRDITVNAVAPGFIDTDMTRALSETQRADLLREIPLNRLGTVEEVAAVVAFLASPAAAYVTGQTINVNGGMYMG